MTPKRQDASSGSGADASAVDQSDTSNGRPWPPLRKKEPTPAEEIGKPGAIVTKEKLRGMTATEARNYANGILGKPNANVIDGHAPGTLRAVAATANGGTERWRILFEWEPIV